MSADGTKEVSIFLRVLSLAAAGEATLADLIYKESMLMMKDPANRDVSSTIAKAVKHQDATLIEVNNFAEAKALQDKLEKEGVYYVARCSYRVNGQDKVAIVVQNQDLEQALAVTHDFYAERNGGICSVEFLNDYSSGRVMAVNALSEEEASLFIQRCEDAHIPVAFEGPDRGAYRMLFAEADAEKMSRVRADVAIAMQGPAKEVYSGQIKWQNDYEKTVMNSIISGKYPDGTSIEDGSALVGFDGSRVEVSKQYIRLYQGESVRRLSRNASGVDLQKNMAEIGQFVKCMEHPVFLGREDYKHLQDLPTQDRGSYLVDKQRVGFLLAQKTYTETLIKDVSDGRSPYGRLHDGDMVVDQRGNEIEIRPSEVIVRMQGQREQRLTRDSSEFTEAVKETMSQMQSPVYIEAATAETYHQMKESERADWVRAQEMKARTFVDGRPALSQEDMRAIGRAEAMRRTVEVSLKKEGVELPKTETMTYNDAARIFGLKTEELDGFQAAVSTGIKAETTDAELESVMDQVVDRFVEMEPQHTIISHYELNRDDMEFNEPDINLEFEQPDAPGAAQDNSWDDAFDAVSFDP